MSVDIEFHDHVGHIILNQPEKRNVLDLETSAKLSDAVRDIEDNSGATVIVLRATGKVFCAGGSLFELIAAQEGDQNGLNDIYAGFLAVAKSKLPTIAAVQGAAVGAGMNLALAADMRVITPRARFDTRFMQLGIHCGGGHSWMLQRFLNWEQSMAALVFGEIIDADKAIQSGLALHCVAEESLLLSIAELCAPLAGVPRELIERSKQSLHKVQQGMSHQQAVQHEFQQQAWSLRQPHAKKKLRSFLEMISNSESQ